MDYNLDVTARPENEMAPDWRWQRYLANRTKYGILDYDEIIDLGLCPYPPLPPTRSGKRDALRDLLKRLMTGVRQDEALGVECAYILMGKKSPEEKQDIATVTARLYCLLHLSPEGLEKDESWVRERVYVPALCRGVQTLEFVRYPMTARFIGLTRFRQWICKLPLSDYTPQMEETMKRIRSICAAAMVNPITPEKARKLIDFAIGPVRGKRDVPEAMDSEQGLGRPRPNDKPIEGPDKAPYT